VITFTHVCKTWREIFTSRSTLWTDFDFKNADKTRVYLERSKSSPIRLWLERDDGLLPHDPFLQIVPHAIDRVRHLFIGTTPDHLQEIIDHLSNPAPLLQDLSVFGSSDDPFVNPMLATTLFGGDLSPLRELCLHSLQTTLPWRNMVNLTTFTLGYVLEPRVTIGQLLDFFESAPSLLDIDLTFSTPAFGAQIGRLVSLAHLRKLNICGLHPPALLFEHLLIPVGVKMSIELDLDGPRIEDYLPKSLDNLKNNSNITKIHIHFGGHFTSMELTGPSGHVSMTSSEPGAATTRSVAQSLVVLDTSKIKWLEILRSEPLSEGFHRALTSMKNLQTLTLSLCKDLRQFILALAPVPDSADPIVCPSLEVLVFRTEERFDVETMVEVAAARASAGSPLKSIRIINWGELVPQEGVMELLKHVSRVKSISEIANRSYGYGQFDDDVYPYGEDTEG